jgi:hypothetical protein
MNPTAKIFSGIALIVCLMSAGCNKPTSGQNTLEYRQGQSGATPATQSQDTKLDSSKEKREQGKPINGG